MHRSAHTLTNSAQKSRRAVPIAIIYTPNLNRTPHFVLHHFVLTWSHGSVLNASRCAVLSALL